MSWRRRLEYLRQLEDKGDYFTLEEMEHRAPLLFDEVCRVARPCIAPSPFAFILPQENPIALSPLLLRVAPRTSCERRIGWVWLMANDGYATRGLRRSWRWVQYIGRFMSDDERWELTGSDGANSWASQLMSVITARHRQSVTLSSLATLSPARLRYLLEIITRSPCDILSYWIPTPRFLPLLLCCVVNALNLSACCAADPLLCSGCSERLEASRDRGWRGDGARADRSPIDEGLDPIDDEEPGQWGARAGHHGKGGAAAAAAAAPARDEGGVGGRHSRAVPLPRKTEGEADKEAREALSEEDKEANREEFERLMRERFLAGLDHEHFDYSKVDGDETLDDLAVVGTFPVLAFFMNVSLFCVTCLLCL